MNPCPNCKACALHKTRTQMVESRGPAPADVLFLVEAPTVADEVTGTLLSGPEGRTLISLCFDAAELAGVKFSMHVAAMTLCRPHIVSGPPSATSVLKCMRNVLAIVEEVCPALIVLVGPVVTDYYKKELTQSITILAPWVLIKQPARYNMNMRALAEGIKQYVAPR